MWKTQSFFRYINMHYLIRKENTADISTVVQDMNAVLHKMYEFKWRAAINRQEAIRGKVTTGWELIDPLNRVMKWKQI